MYILPNCTRCFLSFEGFASLSGILGRLDEAPLESVLCSCEAGGKDDRRRDLDSDCSMSLCSISTNAEVSSTGVFTPSSEYKQFVTDPRHRIEG